MNSSESKIKDKKTVTLNINRNDDKDNHDEFAIKRRPNLQSLFNGEQSNRLLLKDESAALTDNS